MSHKTALIAIGIVALVALAGLVLVIKGGTTGKATKVFSTECYDFCREKQCSSIPVSDRGALYPCLNDCLNNCWAEYGAIEQAAWAKRKKEGKR